MAPLGAAGRRQRHTAQLQTGLARSVAPARGPRGRARRRPPQWVYPLHSLVFRGMIAAIAQQAERRGAQSGSG